MFKNPFSFEGRIRRTEYILSCIISMFLLGLVLSLSSSTNVSIIGSLVFMLLSYWFLLAQGTKRCHDLGKSGWWQIVPFYGLWLFFAKGDLLENKYGKNTNQLI
jgi:uncharacterized membrane protein YhaH (DUF805 family)